MKLPFLASFIIFIIVLSHRIHKQRNDMLNEEKKFWDREQAANSVRKKDLSNLEYITIPIDSLPTNILTDNETVSECIDIIKELSTSKIVNFTGYTNTDLKFEYGAANLQTLSEYDQCYTNLVSTLQRWADELLNVGFEKEAVSIMEFAMSTHTDVSRTYYKLAEYYSKNSSSDKISGLIKIAESLHSSNKEIIARTLKESYL